jgi:adenylylsulfate kinase
MLIVMAGLPGTGKSTLARRLAQELPALVLDKDAVRAALFPPSEIEYSTPQDDLCVEIMLQVARYLLLKDADRHVIIDGRTFSRAYQVEAVRAYARELDIGCAWLECVCSDAVARERLDRDVARGTHPASNRTYQMYLSVKAKAEPIAEPKLVIDTEGDLDAAVAECLAHIGG